MQFMGSLYVGDSIASTEYKIVEKVHKGKIVPNLYLLVLTLNPDNMLEIIPEWEILQKGYPSQDLKVIGIANGKKEAISLVQSIITDSLNEMKTADVSIKVNPERLDLVKTKIIDGQKYIMIRAENNVEVNGVNISFSDNKNENGIS